MHAAPKITVPAKATDRPNIASDKDRPTQTLPLTKPGKVWDKIGLPARQAFSGL